MLSRRYVALSAYGAALTAGGVAADGLPLFSSFARRATGYGMLLPAEPEGDGAEDGGEKNTPPSKKDGDGSGDGGSDPK